jgi:secreted PhoX family phosphatase
VDAANPREDNIYGHIIRWREDGETVLATDFTWDLFVQCGDTPPPRRLPTNDYKGTSSTTRTAARLRRARRPLVRPFGRLWVQTDQVGDGQGDWVNIGANCMVCADPETRETRRFLTGPPNCEVTGITMTPDGRTMFVGIQHPGEDRCDRSANPTQFSNWPREPVGVVPGQLQA